MPTRSDQLGRETVEVFRDAAFLVGSGHEFLSVALDSTIRDTGNSPTTRIRKALVVGRLTASSRWVQYDNSAADGSEVARGILLHQADILDNDGVAVSVAAVVVMSGIIQDADLIGLDAGARTDLSRMTFV